MNANFGLLDPLPEPIRSKRERREELARRALQAMDDWARANAGSTAAGGQDRRTPSRAEPRR